MNLFIRYIQFVFCSLSMVLTGLFVLSLTGATLSDITSTGNAEKVFLTVTFLLIGCCIDIGKYLFWSQRHVTPYFLLLSLTLMLFSWLASCAFLITAEAGLLEKQRLQSAQYLANEQRVHHLNSQILQQERLLGKRIESTFHSQWQAGQETIQKIALLREEIAKLTELLPSVGLDYAQRKVPTARFFADLGQFLSMDAGWVRGLGFGLLSLLLELSTLGIISLAQAFRKRSIPVDEPELIKNHCVDESDDTNRQAVAQLSSDILQGKTPPVIRKIRAAHYGLDIDEIREVLKHLWQAGLLETDKRNSYQLPKCREG